VRWIFDDICLRGGRSRGRSEKSSSNLPKCGQYLDAALSKEGAMVYDDFLWWYSINRSKH
jgi:hypothetical protein